MNALNNLHATITHQSIRRARSVDLGTNDLALAKRRATAEFGGDHSEYVITIYRPSTETREAEIVAERRCGSRRWG